MIHTPLIDRAIYGHDAGKVLRKVLIKLSDLPTESDYKIKSKSLNPTIDCLEKRFNRTGQTPAELFPEGWKLTRYLELVTDRKKMYLHFAHYKNNKKPLTFKS